MKSMTGFGRAAGMLPDGTEANVVARGVNHRFLDVAVKLRDEYAALEPAIRKAVATVASRGHIDVLVRTTRPAGAGVKIDMDAAERYAKEWKEDSSKRGLPGELAARDLLSLPGVLRAEESADGDSSFEASLLDLVEKALRDFDQTRAREGAALSVAFEEILKRIETGVARLDAERAGVSERIQSSLRERIAKLAAGVAVDEARLAQEVALLADRADITEEIDRLKTHLAEL
ncbi:MAG: YicC family protein, partial [Thermoanaerobaculia bacterium]